MRLAKLDLSKYHWREQYDKILEEVDELQYEINTKTVSTKSKILEEAIDIFQTLYGFFEMFATEPEIQEAFDNHIQKLQEREKNRGHKILGYVKLTELADNETIIKAKNLGKIKPKIILDDELFHCEDCFMKDKHYSAEMKEEAINQAVQCVPDDTEHDIEKDRREETKNEFASNILDYLLNKLADTINDECKNISETEKIIIESKKYNVNETLEEFYVLWKNYAQEKDEDLTDKSKELKRILLKFVESLKDKS